MATIKCKVCGTETSATMKFCGSCGSPIEHEITGEPVSEKKLPNFNLKKLLIPAIAVIAVVAAIIILTNVVKPEQYEATKGSVYLSQGGENVIVIPHGKSKIEIEGYLSTSTRNLDGTVAVALIAEDYYSSEGGTLYLISDQPREVASNVETFWIASSGNALVYICETDYDEGIAELWHYANGTRTKITSEFSFYEGKCSISPDGKTVTYVDYDGSNYIGFVWSNGKSTELGKGIAPIAVADGARYIYYYRNDSLYVQQGISGDEREKLGDNVYTLYANTDLSQVVYNYDSKSYISIDGGKRESLSSSTISRFILPSGTASYYSSTIVQYGITDFRDMFYVNNDNAIIHIDGKYETSSVVKNIDSAYQNVYLADDARTLFYLKNGSIYKVRGDSTKDDATELVDSDVVAFIATASGDAVYYIDEAYDIYCQKGTNKSTLVTSDFPYSYTGEGYGLYNGNTFFYVADGGLYSSTGERGKLVTGLTGEIQYATASYLSIFVSSDNDGEILHYRSVDGTNFEMIWLKEPDSIIGTWYYGSESITFKEDGTVFEGSYEMGDYWIDENILYVDGEEFRFSISGDDLYLYDLYGSDSMTLSRINPNAAAFENATTLSLNSSESVSITSTNLRCGFKFTPSTTASYTFESYNNGNCDPYCWLYDSNQTFLASDDDGSSNSNFSLTYRLTAGQTYYILAGCYDDDTGSYMLNVSAS